MNTCPKCKGENIIGVEYDHTSSEQYDGISEYRCNACGYRQGRWTGFELKRGDGWVEIEPRYGQIQAKRGNRFVHENAAKPVRISV